MNSYNNIPVNKLSAEAQSAIYQGATLTDFQAVDTLDEWFGMRGYIYIVGYKAYGVDITKLIRPPKNPFTGKANDDLGAKDDLWSVLLLGLDKDGYAEPLTHPIQDRYGDIQPEVGYLSESEVVALCDRIRNLD